MKPTTGPTPEEEVGKTRATASSDEEWVPEDDTIIGRALRWSLLALAAIVAIGGGVFFFTRDRQKQDVVVKKEVGKVKELTPDLAVLPEVIFVDVTEESGIRFVHCNGATGRKLLPETMGGGVAFFDYDNDRDADLFFVNSTRWPGAAADSPAPMSALYRNDGTGRFQDVTLEAGLTQSFFGMGVACGDYDGDGWVDLLVTALGPSHLYRNEQGRFVEVTEKAGVGGAANEWSTSAGFLDYDNDGDLDLFVGNYVHWTEEIDRQLNFTLNGRDRAYGPPTQYTGTYPCLYRNQGDGTFRDVSEAAGMHVKTPETAQPMAKTLGVCFADFDQDGWIDVAVANDTVQKYLFHNQGDGTFEEIGAQSGIGFDSSGKATGAMGIDIADYRGDRSLAIAIGNFANEMTSLFVSQQGPLLFTDEAIGEGIGAPSRLRLTFGVLFLDYDLDGRLDFFQTNGHLEESINEVQSSQHYEQPAQLFWNGGPERRSCFVEVPADACGDLSRPIVGRGAACADIDRDGDVDCVLTQAGGAPLLLRNDQSLGHHWLKVRLVGSKQRDAIGSWVEVTASGRTQRLQVMPTRSYLSQTELPLTFGLGNSTSIETLTIQWSCGEKQSVPPPQEVDREIVIAQGG